MAFNGYKLTYPNNKIIINNELEETNSILSDDKNSWVLFDPDDDILSSTNTNTQLEELILLQLIPEQLIQEQQDIEEDIEEEEEEEDIEEDIEEEDDIEEDLTDREEEDDDLIDNLESKNLSTRLGQKRLEQLFNKSYNPINNWNLTYDNLINNNDDNLASWDLDENLSINSLDTTILDKSFYYGDEILKTLTPQELKNFKKVEINLKHYLNKKPNYLFDEILIKTLPLSQQLQLKNLKIRNYKQFEYQKNLIMKEQGYSSASSSLIMVGGKD